MRDEMPFEVQPDHLRALCLSAAQQSPPEELPRLIGWLAEAQATAMARLLSPAPAQEPDRLIDVSEVARMICQSVDYVYDHQQHLGGKKYGGSLRFRLSDVQKYMSHKDGLPSLWHSDRLPARRPHETARATNRGRTRKDHDQDAESIVEQGEARCN
jgi:hypothetical protein